MSYAQRQLRLRVIEALTRRARDFRTRHDIWPLRVPREPLLLDTVISDALGPERARLDDRGLKSRSLLTLIWDGGGGSRWEAWVIALPSGLNLYADSSEGESRVLASARRDAEGGDIDTFFLELLAESAGEQFGIEMAGGAPDRVQTTLARRAFLVDFFVDLFEVTHQEDSVRQALPAAEHPPRDFRIDVEEWMQGVLRA